MHFIPVLPLVHRFLASSVSPVQSINVSDRSSPTIRTFTTRNQDPSALEFLLSWLSSNPIVKTKFHSFTPGSPVSETLCARHTSPTAGQSLHVESLEGRGSQRYSTLVGQPQDLCMSPALRISSTPAFIPALLEVLCVSSPLRERIYASCVQHAF